MNLFARSSGGIMSDLGNKFQGMRGRLIAQSVCLIGEGILLIVFSKQHKIASAIPALVCFSFFVQATEGTSFGIVPYEAPGGYFPDESRRRRGRDHAATRRRNVRVEAATAPRRVGEISASHMSSRRGDESWRRQGRDADAPAGTSRGDAADTPRTTSARRRYIAPEGLGGVCAVVGAWGNIGAVCWGMMFKFGYLGKFDKGYEAMGYIIIASAALSFLMRIKGQSHLLGPATGRTSRPPRTSVAATSLYRVSRPRPVVRVATGTSPQPIATKYPRRGRGVAATRLRNIQPRRRRDPSVDIPSRGVAKRSSPRRARSRPGTLE